MASAARFLRWKEWLCHIALKESITHRNTEDGDNSLHPGRNTGTLFTLIPSVLVTIRMIAAADNITISIMEDIPRRDDSPSMRKLGRIPSKDPKRTIKAVANIKMSTESLWRNVWFLDIFNLYLLVIEKRPSFKRFSIFGILYQFATTFMENKAPTNTPMIVAEIVILRISNNVMSKPASKPERQLPLQQRWDWL